MKDSQKILEAAVCGNVKLMKEAIVNAADVNCRNNEGVTPLCFVSKCRFDLVKILVENGACVNLCGDDKISPLHWAAEYDNYEIAEYLVENGADIEVKDNLGETPMHWAAWTGHYKIAELLLKYGVNFDAVNAGGVTPMDLIIQQEHSRMLTAIENYKKSAK